MIALLGMNRLEAATAPGAFHNSRERFDPPKCHPRTREGILEKIKDWATKKIDSNAFVMWLYGTAGAGKSAIAQSIAELCHEMDLLLASFFFSSRSPHRSTSSHLFASLTYQLVRAIPAMRDFVESAIDLDPLIFQQSLEAQFVTLLAQPFRRLLEIHPPEKTQYPCLIVLDGLDECTDGSRRGVLGSIFDLTKRFSLPFIFLIASRPEQDILSFFNSTKVQDYCVRIPLDHDYRSYDDIERFFHDKFAEMREDHPLRSQLTPSWPSEQDIETLVRESSGQFIYSTTVIKYISSPRHRPTQRLKIILGTTPADRDLPFAELDGLYRTIILSVDDPDMTVRILATLFCLASWNHLSVLEHCLSLDPGDSLLYLGDLGSLVYVENDLFWFSHLSLGEFLFDKSRSGALHVDRAMVHAGIARSCLHLLQQIPVTGVLLYIFLFLPIYHIRLKRLKQPWTTKS